APELLDDARYLPGPEHAEPAYDGIVGSLQEIDANLEYVHFLLGLEKEHPLRQRFFEVIADYPALASSKLQTVARQFQQPPAIAARIEPVRWEPDASHRWEDAAHDVRPVPDPEPGRAPVRVPASGRCRASRASSGTSGEGSTVRPPDRDGGRGIERDRESVRGGDRSSIVITTAGRR